MCHNSYPSPLLPPLQVSRTGLPWESPPCHLHLLSFSSASSPNLCMSPPARPFASILWQTQTNTSLTLYPTYVLWPPLPIAAIGNILPNNQIPRPSVHLLSLPTRRDRDRNRKRHQFCLIPHTTSSLLYQKIQLESDYPPPPPPHLHWCMSTCWLLFPH